MPHPQAPAFRHRLFTADDHLILLADNSSHLPTKHKKRTATPGLEVEFVGTFPSFWDDKSVSHILEASGDNKPIGEEWFPGTEDLREFAKQGGKHGHTPVQVTDLRGMLYKLGKYKPGTIRRLNLFTHADKGVISLSGRVTADNVMMNVGRESLDDIFMEDAESEIFGSEGMNQDQIYRENITIEKVRKAFQQDSEVVIYACHGGLDAPYLKKIGRLFGGNVKIKGFTKMIRYTIVPDKHRKRIVKRTYGIQGSAVEVTNFHSLQPDASSDP